MHGAAAGHATIVERLLVAGADASVTGRGGESAITLAAQRAHDTVLRTLLAAGASANTLLGHGGNSALTLAASARTGYDSCVLLIGAGARVDHAAADGFTPLMAAARQCVSRTLELLIINGAPVDAVWDRAALIAIPIEDRERYVAHLSKQLKDGGRVLLVTLDYDQALMEGPPFALTDDQVEALFTDGWTRERLLRGPASLPPRAAERGVTAEESVWLITKS